MQHNAFDIAKAERCKLEHIIFIRLRDKLRSTLKVVTLRQPVGRREMALVAMQAEEEVYYYDSETVLLSDIREINSRREELVFGSDTKPKPNLRQRQIARQRLLATETQEDRKKRLEWERKERLRKYLFSKPGKNVKITYHVKEVQ